MNQRQRFSRLWMLGIAAALAAFMVIWCVRHAPTVPVAESPKLQLQRHSFSTLPGWAGADLIASWQALGRSCKVIHRQTGEIGTPSVHLSAAALHSICRSMSRLGSAPTHAQMQHFFESNFVPYKIAGADSHEQGLFTGYYVPELQGSLTRTSVYSVPVYGRPKDLVTVDLGAFKPEWHGQVLMGQLKSGRVTPFATSRAAINQGALAHAVPQVMWLKDKVSRFFMQVQGSGVVRTPDGRRFLLRYAAKNNAPYTSIGKVMLREHVLQPGKVTMQSVKTWLRTHTQQAAQLLEHNASFVFFQRCPFTVPQGAEHVALTPKASLAVDRTFLPLGIPLWVVVNAKLGQQALLFRQLMVAQDSGAAIRGPIRGDVYWGVGRQAGEIAGKFYGHGAYWVFLPRA